MWSYALKSSKKHGENKKHQKTPKNNEKRTKMRQNAKEQRFFPYDGWHGGYLGFV